MNINSNSKKLHAMGVNLICSKLGYRRAGPYVSSPLGAGSVHVQNLMKGDFVTIHVSGNKNFAKDLESHHHVFVVYDGAKIVVYRGTDCHLPEKYVMEVLSTGAIAMKYAVSTLEKVLEITDQPALCAEFIENSLSRRFNLESKYYR